jgi:hypothetical protein
MQAYISTNTVRSASLLARNHAETSVRFSLLNWRALHRSVATQDTPISLKLRGAASTDTIVGSLRPGASAASERDLRCAAADFFGQFRPFFAAISRIAGSAVASRGVVLTVAGTPPVGIRLAQRESRPPIQPSAQFLEAKYSRTSLVLVSGWGSCRNPFSWRKATSLLVVSAACGSATLVDTSSVGV